MGKTFSKSPLLHDDAHFRSLFDKHEQLEGELKRLKQQKFLSEDDQMQAQEMKKKKLLLKEEMDRLTQSA